MSVSVHSQRRAAARITMWVACFVISLVTTAALGTPALQDGAKNLRADARSAAAVDPLLCEAVRWYTGVAGHMDDARAAVLLQQALVDKDPLSIMWLARVYSTGRMGYAQDRRRARTLASSVVDEIQRLAIAGVDEAAFLMGTAYAEGLGKRRNARQAAAWYRQAALSGHILASHNLGNALAAGKGVQKDPEQAARWWRIAADAGDAVTQFRLGQAFERGYGVDRDKEAAAHWYRAAAERGYEPARRALERRMQRR